MTSMTKMAAAAKLAEERIRLDIGDDISVEDEVTHSSQQHLVYKSTEWQRIHAVPFPSTLHFAWSRQRHQPR